MKNIRYTGHADLRILKRSELAALEVDHDALVWEGHDDVISVTNAIGDLLLEKHPEQFVDDDLEDEDEQFAEGVVQKNPFSSEDDETPTTDVTLDDGAPVPSISEGPNFTST